MGASSGTGARIASLGVPALGAALAGGLTLGAFWTTGSPLAAAGAVALAMVATVAIADGMAAASRRARRELQRALQRLALGDTDARLDAARMEPLGDEAALFNQLTETLGASVARLGERTRNLQALPDPIARVLGEMQTGAEDQEASVEETASLQAHINTAIRGINEEVENLARSNEETASSILEMSSAVEQVARSSETLQQTVDASASSVHQMTENIHRVAASSDNVQQVAEETAASIVEMDRTIQQVGEHVRGASSLTEQVAERAEEGSRAVGATIDSIAAIRELTRGAKTALEGLAERIGEIGQIAGVIGGISDETNLLSLNAAIIAAQAGEHGKAFAVVADQVKTLAQRTTSSTKEIDRLIQSVQQESENAVLAMEKGIEGVEDGVSRSRFAGDALETIRISASEASGRVSEIAHAADEQGRNSKHVAEAARRTSEHVHEISQAMGEQSKASAQLVEHSTGSLEMCKQVTRATEEQRSTAKYIRANIEAITDMILSIQEKTRSQTQASGAVAETSLAMLEQARKGSERIPEIARVIDDLREHAGAVAAEVARFEPRS